MPQDLFHKEARSPAMVRDRRIAQILQSIETSGTYSHTFDELQHGQLPKLVCEGVGASDLVLSQDHDACCGLSIRPKYILSYSIYKLPNKDLANDRHPSYPDLV